MITCLSLQQFVGNFHFLSWFVNVSDSIWNWSYLSECPSTRCTNIYVSRGRVFLIFTLCWWYSIYHRSLTFSFVLNRDCRSFVNSLGHTVTYVTVCVFAIIKFDTYILGTFVVICVKLTHNYWHTDTECIDVTMNRALFYWHDTFF